MTALVQHLECVGPASGLIALGRRCASVVTIPRSTLTWGWAQGHLISSAVRPYNSNI